MAENREKMPLPKITSLDDFFTTQEQRDNDSNEKVVKIPINEISDFPDHPFKVVDDEKMEDMVQSIKENGVIYPAIVRQKEDGKYEMIAGHRRKHACNLANVKEMPCIVRDLSDDEATIYMVDSNIQREKILPSEKAFAYKMKLEAIKRQGARTDLTSSHDGKKLSAELIGEEFGDSKNTVYRYIRLTYLIPELLELCDTDEIKLTPASELSFLSEYNQQQLLNLIKYFQAKPSVPQAQQLRKLEEEGKLTIDKLEEIMSEEKPNQKPTIKLNEDRFEKILPQKLHTSKEKEDFIFKCVEFYVNRQRNRDFAR